MAYEKKKKRKENMKSQYDGSSGINAKLLCPSYSAYLLHRNDFQFLTHLSIIHRL